MQAVSTAEAGRLREQWLTLCADALQPNVFLHPGFALPLLGKEASPRYEWLLVYCEQGGKSDLVGLWPVRSGLPGVLRGYSDKLVSIGVPLLDRRCAPAAFDAMPRWLESHRKRAALAIVSGVPLSSQFHRLIVDLNAHRQVAILGRHHRANLQMISPSDDPLSRKSRKEWARLRRRLAEHGTLSYRSATKAADIGQALDEFLALENSGWKGRRGTSLIADPATATFVRQMVIDLASVGQCRVDALYCGERMVAAGVILRSAAQCYFWKTAFAEDLAKYSPGVLFTLDLTERQHADLSIAATDSCAVANHPMIDRIWSGRLDIADVCIATSSRRSRSFALALAVERGRRNARARLKALYRHIRRSSR